MQAQGQAPPTGWDCHVHVFDGSRARQHSHYQPQHRPLEEIEAVATRHGCGHLVLVQPSVYGSDNTLLLNALRASSERHRGVIVLRGDESADELTDMHALGVRGIRFNLVSPMGSERAEAEVQLRQFGPVLEALGWHVQWYAEPGDLPLLQRWQSETQLPFVFDHLAGITPATHDEAQWRALAELAGADCWIKLSGWYRLQAQAPYAALTPQIQLVAELFGDRMVWGSDWPHTSFAAQDMPEYGSVWEPVVVALGEETAQRVRTAGSRLYL
jgi:predicted TIM-barrel fold metal-dependent hydrolase